MFTLRSARQEEANQIYQMVRQARINPTNLDWSRFVVAITEDNQLVGCVQIKPHKDSSRELASLVVTPGKRRQGIARALVRHMQLHHAPPLYLTCRAELGPFYEQFGFITLSVEQMPPYFKRLKRLVSMYERYQQKQLLLVMAWLYIPGHHQ